jgi:hypothetical protein
MVRSENNVMPEGLCETVSLHQARVLVLVHILKYTFTIKGFIFVCANEPAKRTYKTKQSIHNDT